jgi:hypothetical protein
LLPSDPGHSRWGATVEETGVDTDTATTERHRHLLLRDRQDGRSGIGIHNDLTRTHSSRKELQVVYLLVRETSFAKPYWQNRNSITLTMAVIHLLLVLPGRRSGVTFSLIAGILFELLDFVSWVRFGSLP